MVRDEMIITQNGLLSRDTAYSITEHWHLNRKPRMKWNLKGLVIETRDILESAVGNKEKAED